MNRDAGYYLHQRERMMHKAESILKTFAMFNEVDSLGRFVKKDIFDCGIPGCVYCHPEKQKKRRFTLNASFEDEILDEYGVERLEEFLN